ncbi:MAG: NADPH:quinone oxidoreductase family protein [Bryobacteraceae bacterium]
MKAWQVHAFGEPEQMTLADVPAPVAAPGQVRIRVHAAALNFFDILQIQGKYQVKPPFPFTPGAELAGVVEPGGERVLALPHLGAFAEYALSPPDRVFPIPSGWSFAEAAAFPTVYFTSYFALDRRASLRSGEWLLVHAGASGVGMAAIQIGKALGARVIATAGSEEKLDFSRRIGADFALDYSRPDWVDEVKRITGGPGADVIYDPVGGDIFDLSTRCIAPEGRLLVVGFAAGRIPSLAMNRVLLKDISVVGVYWGAYVARHAGYLGETYAALLGLNVRPVVGSTYRFEDAPAALRNLAGRGVLGKAVLLI